MKKIIVIVFVFLISSFSFYCFAQLKEVRGIQTRSILYDSESRPNKYGFEFKNENNYAVWVEAELWATHFTVPRGHYIKNDVRDTKNFTLGPGETYRWKCGDRMIFWSYNEEDFHEKFYVKYTAYKAE